MDMEDILNQCTNILPGYRRRRPMKEIFADLAERLEGNEYLDGYGSGKGLAAFEGEGSGLSEGEHGTDCLHLPDLVPQIHLSGQLGYYHGIQRRHAIDGNLMHRRG